MTTYLTTCLQLTPSAIPELIELEKQCAIHPWTTKQFVAAFTQKNYYTFGIHAASNKLIAYISFYHIQDELEILNIVVKKHMQQKGYGKHLLGTILHLGHKKGILRATLEVRSSNIPAIALYKGFGFIQVGIRHNYYTDPYEDALIYTRDLTMNLSIIHSMEFSCEHW